MKSFSNPLEHHIPNSHVNHQWPQIFSIVSASLGCLSLGALATWTSPSVPVLISNSSYAEPITLEEASYFTVIPPISAALASPIITILADRIGRKKIVLSIAVFYFFAWLLIISARTLLVFYMARFVEGIGDAAVFICVPMYVGEIAEPSVRGTWGNLIAFGMFLGQFLINTISAYFDIQTTGLILGSVTILEFIFSLFIPESPYFLLMKNREKEARSSLQILRWRRNVEEELKTLNDDVQREMAEAGSLKDLFFDGVNLKTLLISIALRASQPFSGLQAFGMYTQYMFEQAGSNLSASTSAIIFTGVFLITITCFSFVVDRFGRKPLMTYSCLGCFIILSVEAAYFFVHEKTDIDATEFSWIPLSGMLLYIPACSAGLGIIPTLMLGELFSTNIKANALCILNIFFSIFVLSATKLFQTLSSNFGMYVPFCLFAACCLVNTPFSYFLIPETKGKTLEEIQDGLRDHKKHVYEKRKSGSFVKF